MQLSIIVVTVYLNGNGRSCRNSLISLFWRERLTGIDSNYRMTQLWQLSDAFSCTYGPGWENSREPLEHPMGSVELVQCSATRMEPTLFLLIPRFDCRPCPPLQYPGITPPPGEAEEFGTSCSQSTASCPVSWIEEPPVTPLCQSRGHCPDQCLCTLELGTSGRMYPRVRYINSYVP